MDPSILQVSYLSVLLVILFGFLIILIIFWSKAKKGGFQSRRLEETSTLLTYEQMLKQGKISREEYNRITNALMQKQGFAEPSESIPQSKESLSTVESLVRTEKKRKKKTKSKYSRKGN